MDGKSRQRRGEVQGAVVNLSEKGRTQGGSHRPIIYSWGGNGLWFFVCFIFFKEKKMNLTQ